MSQFIANLKDGMYFVYIVEFTNHGTVIVETLKGKREEIDREDLMLT